MTRSVVTIRDHVFYRAVRQHWALRDLQMAEQRQRGVSDQGSRPQVTGGKQMDGFIETLVDLMCEAGVPGEFVHRASRTLPGYYRASKDWDLLVVREGRLIAAVEAKAQIGPSFGNNLNNRVEEAVGSAEDLWRAFQEGCLGATRPWLGYLFLLEDCPRSRGPVTSREPHFPVMPEFQGASYARRYELLCQRLVLERKYDAACLLLSDRKRWQSRPNYTEPNPNLGARQFIASLLGHVAPPVQ